MIRKDLLEKINIEQSDIDYILEIDKIYGKEIEVISNEYMVCESRTDCKTFLERAIALSKDDTDEYIMKLLFWLHGATLLHEEFRERNVSDEVFYSTMEDIRFKMKECRNVYGKCGVFVDWFYFIFEHKYFGLGRLQYEPKEFPYKIYKRGDYEIKKGDAVYGVHIPSNGPLTYESVIDSFKQAYEFFKKDLKDGILPLLCISWLIYEPYEKLFSEGSNMYNFSKMFDRFDFHIQDGFPDCWRIFNKNYEDRHTGMPAKTSLQKNFTRYMEENDVFGEGIGMVLFDGEKIL